METKKEKEQKKTCEGKEVGPDKGESRRSIIYRGSVSFFSAEKGNGGRVPQRNHKLRNHGLRCSI